MSECSCGSKLQRRPLYDGRGLFCAFVCDVCEQRVRSKYRPEIMNRWYTQEDVDESIEEDE